MALTTEQLNARRARTLLKCQKAREQRRRADAMRADREVHEAEGVEEDARDAVDTGRAEADERLRGAYSAQTGRRVASAAVGSLMTLERRLDGDHERRTAAVSDARQAADGAREAAAKAGDALLSEARATRKRERLSDRSERIVRTGLDAAEEMERDEQVADTWTAR